MATVDLDAITLAQHTAFSDSLLDTLRQAYATWLDTHVKTLEAQDISEAVVLVAVGEFAAEVLAGMLSDATPKALQGILRSWSAEVRRSVGEIVRADQRLQAVWDTKEGH